MSSQPRSAREEERRLNIRTLVIASVASAAAAAITSQFWIQGTWVAAALTPVIVTLVSELLNRPTEAIAQRVTSRGIDVLPEAGAAAPPPRERAPGERAPAEPPERAPADPGSEAGPAAPPVRVYRAGAKGKSLRPRTRRQKIAVGTVALTALVAFAIAAVAITGAELVTGESIGKGGRDTTFFGGESKQTDKPKEEPQPAQPESSQPEQGETDTGGQETQPQQEPSQPEEEPPPESQPPPAPKAPEAPAPQQ